MLVLQFAYKKAEVIRILPFFAANCIVVPVFGGVLCLGEELNIMQWIGVIGIMGGLVLLTVKGRRKME
jgi:drug/metabolite transporter (DMT)-like permease